MPPLISEDPEDYSEEEEPSRESVEVEEAVDGEATSTSGTLRVVIPAKSRSPQQPQSEPARTGQSPDQEFEDANDLVAQLQRSAQLDGHESEPEGVIPDADADDDEIQQDDEVQSNPARNATDVDMNDVLPNVDAETSGYGTEAGDEAEEEDEQASNNEGNEEEDEGEEDGSGEEDVEDDSEEGNGSESEESEEDEDSAHQSADSGDEETVNPSCLFCNSSEDRDSGDDSLTCIACERPAHQHCAREVEALTDDYILNEWKCPECAGKINSESPKSVLARARTSNSAPRLVRDLLPVSRGVQKPNSHSIFAQPLISDGEDGGRSLRKRKSPTQEPVPMSKRIKATPKSAAPSSDMAAQEAERAVAHSTRRANQLQKAVPTARILQYRPYHKPPPHKFILAFRLEQEKIAKILSKLPRPGKRRDRRKQQPKIPPPTIQQPPVPKFPALPPSNLIFPSIFTERESEINAKPYGGVLAEADADTTRSLPQWRDREVFESARKDAEEERRRTSAAAEEVITGEHMGSGKPNRTVSGPPSKIKCIQFGKFVIDTFYAAPYPEEYSHESRLFICEFCLKYLPSEFVAYRHKLKCPAKHPPGDEIYRDGSISIWEVDGRKKTEYCQCLCLMAKMFLGSKTLYYDVEPFLFYILTEYDELGYHFVGYFSKEKRPASQNNVSCILVMPIHQRKGYATFLIDFSYLLTRIEGKEGSPEKPLSDMGLTAYRSYWDLTISKHLLELGLSPFSTKSLMARTGMTADDVIHSLERLYAFTRDPVTKVYAVRYDKKLYESIVNDFETKNHRNLKSENLIWTPYVMGRSDQAILDGQPMHTIAPREEDMEVAEDSQEVESSKQDTEAYSPKSKSKSAFTSRPQSVTKEDPELVNEHGAIAPGPPSTDVLNASVAPNITSPIEPKINGITHSDDSAAELNPAESLEEPILTGYALAYREHNIPPARFQIEPPIPPSMLRNRSIKKRKHGRAFGTPANGAVSPLQAVAVRSSPRNAGSVNGDGVRELVTTPVRRSHRKSGLANVETLDGSVDGDVHGDEERKHEEEEEVEGSDEEEEEEEADEVEESDEHGGSSSGEEEVEVEEEEEEDDDDEDKDPDVEVADDEEEESSEDEEADAEVEAEDDEEQDDDDEEGDEEASAAATATATADEDEDADEEDEDEEQED